MFQQILDTAKSDEELKGLIETWTEAVSYTHLDVYKRQGTGRYFQCMQGI